MRLTRPGARKTLQLPPKRFSNSDRRLCADIRNLYYGTINVDTAGSLRGFFTSRSNWRTRGFPLIQMRRWIFYLGTTMPALARAVDRARHMIVDRVQQGSCKSKRIAGAVGFFRARFLWEDICFGITRSGFDQLWRSVPAGVQQKNLSEVDFLRPLELCFAVGFRS